MGLKVAVPVIYVAYCTISGKCYVGQSIEFEQRKKNHLREAFDRKKNCLKKFHPALRKHGIDSFIWSIILCSEPEKLTEWELYWCEKLDSIKDGYNCMKPGTEFDETLRKKMSEAKNGRIISPEWAMKISEGNKGKKYSKETREKISLAHLKLWSSGYTREPITKTVREKMSRSHLGQNHTEDFYCSILLENEKTKEKI